MPCKYFPQKVMQELIVLRRDRASVREIAAKLGRSETRIRQVLAFHQIKKGAPIKAIEPKSEEAMRECLSCHKQFKSSGPGNRICKKCKDSRRGNGYGFDVARIL